MSFSGKADDHADLFRVGHLRRQRLLHQAERVGLLCGRSRLGEINGSSQKTLWPKPLDSFRIPRRTKQDFLNFVTAVDGQGICPFASRCDLWGPLCLGSVCPPLEGKHLICTCRAGAPFHENLNADNRACSLLQCHGNFGPERTLGALVGAAARLHQIGRSGPGAAFPTISRRQSGRSDRLEEGTKINSLRVD